MFALPGRQALLSLKKHFEDIAEDQFDFHQVRQSGSRGFCLLLSSATSV